MITFDMLSRDGERKYNEDSVRGEIRGEQACFVLADGLGGHGGGDIASALAADCVMEIFERDGLSDSFHGDCFDEVQTRIVQQRRELGCEGAMKTTLVILAINGELARWGHVGDSRLYCFRRNRLKCRTIDHSVPQMLAMSGKIREKDIRGHEDRNRLLHVMGAEEDEQVTPELTEWIRMDGRVSFLLCSDGFWEWIVEKDMQRCLRKASDAADWNRRMEEIVRKNGTGRNMDNYSAIAVML